MTSLTLHHQPSPTPPPHTHTTVPILKTQPDAEVNQRSSEWANTFMCVVQKSQTSGKTRVYTDVNCELLHEDTSRGCPHADGPLRLCTSPPATPAALSPRAVCDQDVECVCATMLRPSWRALNLYRFPFPRPTCCCSISGAAPCKHATPSFHPPPRATPFLPLTVPAFLNAERVINAHTEVGSFKNVEEEVLVGD